MRDKRIEHKQYVHEHGDDLPEVRDWTWPGPSGEGARAQRRVELGSKAALYEVEPAAALAAAADVVWDGQVGLGPG